MGENTRVSIPQSFIQELLSRVDVVDIVGRYVQLKKGGANFMGLCPFHGEKSPSFSVSPSKQFYHCFGCGKNGNAISFLMDHAGMGFIEAVNDLAQSVGLQVPDDDISPQDRERAAAARQKQATLTDVLEKAADAYRRHLRESQRAIGYFKARGVSGHVAKRYGLGYAPEGWRSLASVFPAYDDPLLEESGLVIVNEEDGGKRYDRFRDRVMFPIRNVKGECIGFGGRVLGDEKPKYLNSPETPVFHKGRELYGLLEARTPIREAGYALVTEGYMDVVALAQLGFPNAVATLGTACTQDHVQKLVRFTDNVVFSFDGDAAGRRAARKALDAALPLASDTRSFKFLFLPTEHDPDSFIRAYGKDDFARFVADAVPLSRFLVESASEGCDLGQAEGRAHMASNARPLWLALPDGALKRQLLGELADLVQLTPRELGELWHVGPKGDTAQAATPSRSNYQKDSYTRRYSDRKKPFISETSDWGAPRQTRRGVAPMGRSDQAARLLLNHMDFMEALTHEDHNLLCAQPEPYGPLFVWLEGQFHEHGVQTWVVLRERLRGHPCEALALRVMDGPLGVTDGEPSELMAELRGVLDRNLIAHIKQQENDAVAAMSTDPTAAQRLRELHAQRLSLEAKLRKPA